MLVMLGWWRILFGGRERRDAPSRDNQMEAIDTIECRKAVHEAGHAVAAWCCTAATDVRITIEASDGGRVDWTMNDSGIDVEWHMLVITLAGAAAEAMVYKRSRREASSKNDFRAAREHAERIGSTDSPWKDPGGPTIAFEKIYHAPPLSTTARANLEAAYRMARHVIRAHGRDYYRIVSLLLTRRTVSERDVVHILGDRAPMRLLKPFGPRFVLPRRTKKAA